MTPPADSPQSSPTDGLPQPVDPFLLGELSKITSARAELMSSVASDAAGAPAPVLAAIDSAVDELAASLIETSHDLAAHPEVALEEHRSAAQLAELVESHGITVTRGAYGLPTALRAEVTGSGPGPSIAVLSE